MNTLHLFSGHRYPCLKWNVNTQELTHLITQFLLTEPDGTANIIILGRTISIIIVNLMCEYIINLHNTKITKKDDNYKSSFFFYIFELISSPVLKSMILWFELPLNASDVSLFVQSYIPSTRMSDNSRISGKCSRQYSYV